MASGGEPTKLIRTHMPGLRPRLAAMFAGRTKMIQIIKAMIKTPASTPISSGKMISHAAHLPCT